MKTLEGSARVFGSARVLVCVGVRVCVCVSVSKTDFSSTDFAEVATMIRPID